MPFMLVVVLTSILFLGQAAIAQEVLVHTGFEEFTLGEPPTDWEVRGNQMQVTATLSKQEMTEMRLWTLKPKKGSLFGMLP